MPVLLNRYRLILCPSLSAYPGVGAVEHLADSRIELEWDEELFAALGPPLEDPALRRCRPRRLPPGVTFLWHGDEGLHVRTCDLRGHRLTHVTAGELADLVGIFAGGPSTWNGAVHAFLAAAPRDIPVVLFWS